MKRLAGWLSMLVIAVEASTAWGQSQAWRSKEEVVALAKRIDDYIAATQKAAGVTPVPPADHGTFFRRLHIDLVGRIPEYTDSRGYIEDDDPEKLWDRSGRFLGEPSYGKHFAAVLRSHILNAANQQAQPFLPPFELWLKEQLEKYNSLKSKKGKKAKTATGDEDKQKSSKPRDKEPSETEGINPSDEPEDSSAQKADDESTKQKGTIPDDSGDSDESSSSDRDDPRK